MGRHEAGPLWQTMTEAMFNPSIDILQTWKTTPGQNWLIKICILRHIVSIKREREMETDSLSVKDNGTCWMRLRLTLQATTISNSSSTQGMDTVPWRKRTTFQSPDRLQKPDTVHDKQGVNRWRDQIERSLKRLRLQNQLLIENRWEQTRHSNQLKSSHAPERRCVMTLQIRSYSSLDSSPYGIPRSNQIEARPVYLVYYRQVWVDTSVYKVTWWHRVKQGNPGRPKLPSWAGEPSENMFA